MRQSHDLHVFVFKALFIGFKIESSAFRKRYIFNDRTALFGRLEPGKDVRCVFDFTGKDDIAFVQEFLCEIDGDDI